MQFIRPATDLCNSYSEISKFCHESRQPVYLTEGGRGDTVILSIAAYEQMKSEMELFQILAESEEDFRQGREAPMQQTFDEIRVSLMNEATK